MKVTTTGVWLRRLVVADRPLVRAMHRRCSSETLRRRCLQPVCASGQDRVADALVDWMFDPRVGVTIAAIPSGADRIVGLGHLVRTDDAGVGAVGFLVEDAWQRRGVGALLVDRVSEQAVADGYRRIVGDVLPENEAMLRILRRRQWSVLRRDGACDVTRDVVGLDAAG